MSVALDLSFEERDLYPVKTFESLETLFRCQLTKSTEPDLAYLSILIGAIENSLTTTSKDKDKVAQPEVVTTKSKKAPSKKSKKKSKDDKSATESIDENNQDTNGSFGVGDFPPVSLEQIENLHGKFHSMINSKIGIFERLRTKDEDSNEFCTSRDTVRKVADVIWNSLSKSYSRDRPHIQTLYTFLTDSRLDCFGVAFAVVAACQVIGSTDVHLALSEDHSWVAFGPNHKNDAEITWHGKGNDVKRGSTTEGINSWLYLNNHGKRGAVVCDRKMEVATLVSSINSSISHSADSEELGIIHKNLLWMMYDLGHLERYPLAMANLGDLEEVQKSRGPEKARELYQNAIESSKKYYSNLHVYPYTYYGAYLKRRKDFRGAIAQWANAADVIKNYTFTKCDEEIYKEFFQISTDLLTIVKECSAGISSDTPTRDSKVFANVLRIFDGICLWEEQKNASSVLHITWAKNWIGVISRFDYSARSSLVFLQDESMKVQSTNDDDDVSNSIVSVIIKSQKMNAISEFLGSSEKINSNMIELQLTAQAGHSLTSTSRDTSSKFQSSFTTTTTAASASTTPTTDHVKGQKRARTSSITLPTATAPVKASKETKKKPTKSKIDKKIKQKVVEEEEKIETDEENDEENDNDNKEKDHYKNSSTFSRSRSRSRSPSLSPPLTPTPLPQKLTKKEKKTKETTKKRKQKEPIKFDWEESDEEKDQYFKSSSNSSSPPPPVVVKTKKEPKKKPSKAKESKKVKEIKEKIPEYSDEYRSSSSSPIPSPIMPIKGRIYKPAAAKTKAKKEQKPRKQKEKVVNVKVFDSDFEEKEESYNSSPAPSPAVVPVPVPVPAKIKMKKEKIPKSNNKDNNKGGGGKKQKELQNVKVFDSDFEEKEEIYSSPQVPSPVPAPLPAKSKMKKERMPKSNNKGGGKKQKYIDEPISMMLEPDEDFQKAFQRSYRPRSRSRSRSNSRSNSHSPPLTPAPVPIFVPPVPVPVKKMKKEPKPKKSTTSKGNSSSKKRKQIEPIKVVDSEDEEKMEMDRSMSRSRSRSRSPSFDVPVPVPPVKMTKKEPKKKPSTTTKPSKKRKHKETDEENFEENLDHVVLSPVPSPYSPPVVAAGPPVKPKKEPKSRSRKVESSKSSSDLKKKRSKHRQEIMIEENIDDSDGDREDREDIDHGQNSTPAFASMSSIPRSTTPMSSDWDNGNLPPKKRARNNNAS